MKNNLFDSSPNGGSGAERLEHALQEINVDQLARQTRFCRRTPRKLSPLTFLHSCFLVLLQSKASLRQWALVIGLVRDQTYAKQSLFKRLNPAALAFVQRVLQALLLRLSLGVQRVLPPALAPFKRVLLQDSVIISLAPKLARAFPGTGNQFGPRRGMLRVQVWLDLKHEQFVRFTHGPYNRNDQTAAQAGLEELQAGDLLIRDLGFYVLSALRRLQDLGVSFLSRLRTDAKLFYPDGRPLNLAGALRGRDSLDQPVLLGGGEKLPVRLVALKVPDKVANERRRKARQKRRYQPTRRHLLLLGWNLYITNVGRPTWSTLDVGRVYGLRWRIETTFRAWKQYFQLEDMPAGSATEVLLLLYARLLFISLFQVQYLGACDYQIQKEAAQPVSQEKLAAFMPVLVSTLLLAHLQPRLPSALSRQVAYHCTYEKRQRKHFIDMLQLS
jgi:Transposase DDE domain